MIVLGSLTLAAAPSVLAQQYHVGAERSVLQYDYASENAFGGWRFEAGWAPTGDVKLVGTIGYWPNLFRQLPRVDGSRPPRGAGSDQTLELRFFPGGFRRVSFYSIIGAGHFKGPDRRVPGFVFQGPDGVAIVAGVGFEVAVYKGFGLNVAGLRREDDGGADYEARVGAFWAGGRRHEGRPRSRVAAGLTTLTSASGTYQGNGPGWGVDLVRQVGARTEGYFGVDLVPVLGSTNVQGTTFGVDTGLLLFSLGGRQAVLPLGGSTLRVDLGFAAATFQEGIDAGIRPGLRAGFSVLLPVGSRVSLIPAVGLLTFDRKDAPNQSFLVLKVSLGYGDAR